MPHIHLLQGIIGAILLKHFNLGNSSMIWFIIGSISPDFDILYGYITKQNHRNFITHYPITWLSIGCFFGIMGFSVFWFFVGAFIHILIDLIDWEIYILAPLSIVSFSLLKLDYKKMIEGGSIVDFLLGYYRNKSVVFIEAGIVFFFAFIFMNFL
ncbi:MAG: metal-dependent hydrolase [Candidatus Hodarchaeota archaeon]